MMLQWTPVPLSSPPFVSVHSLGRFTGAFMSFMAVAYIPAYIEDYEVFRKDRQNGLYGPLEFQLSNFLIGLPYLCES